MAKQYSRSILNKQTQDFPEDVLASSIKDLYETTDIINHLKKSKFMSFIYALLNGTVIFAICVAFAIYFEIPAFFANKSYLVIPFRDIYIIMIFILLLTICLSICTIKIAEFKLLSSRLNSNIYKLKSIERLIESTKNVQSMRSTKQLRDTP